MAHQRRSPGLRPRGDGTRGPRHSSAPGWPAPASAVCSELGIDMLAASVLGVGTFAWMIAMVGMWLLVDGCRTAVRAVLWQRKSLSVVGLVFLCVFVEFLRGGFNLEGNMEQPLTEEAELWLAAVEAEQRAIEALPFVKSVTFTYGETANLCKVLGTVWCCWQPSRGSFKQVAVACHLPATWSSGPPIWRRCASCIRSSSESTAAQHTAPIRRPSLGGQNCRRWTTSTRILQAGMPLIACGLRPACRLLLRSARQQTRASSSKRGPQK